MSDSWGAPSRYPLHRILSAGLVICALSAGCKASGTVDRYLDQPSQVRLSAIGGNRNVLISLHGFSSPPELPPLDGGRVLARIESAVLLDIPRGSLPRLTDVPQLNRAVVWGEGPVSKFMEPGARARLLEVLDGADPEAAISLLATFREPDEALRDRLAATGAAPRTVAGRVVTLDAAPESIFEILSLEGLVNLSLPRKLQLYDENN